MVVRSLGAFIFLPVVLAVACGDEEPAPDRTDSGSVASQDAGSAPPDGSASLDGGSASVDGSALPDGDRTVQRLAERGSLRSYVPHR